MKILPQNMNLSALLHFHYVAKFESLTKAAQHLHVSAPAITHSLNKLENELGTTLCHRSRGGFHLTTEGHELFKRTKNIVGELESFLDQRADPKSYEGIFSVGVMDNLDNARVQSALNKLVQHYPKIKLSILVLSSEDITSALVSGELDFGFSLFHEKDERLSYLEVGRSTMRYYISNKHPLWNQKAITKDDLAGHHVAWIQNRRHTLAQLQTEIFVDHPGYKMKVSAASNHLDGALMILKSGYAVVPIPPQYIEKLKSEKNIRELKIQTKAPLFVEEAAFLAKANLSGAAHFFLQALKS